MNGIKREETAEQLFQELEAREVEGLKGYIEALKEYEAEQARMGAPSDSFVCLITLTVSALARAAGWLRVVGWVRGGKR